MCVWGVYVVCMCGLLMPSFLNSLYILDITSLLDMALMKIFFHSVICHFVLLKVSFGLTEAWQFHEVPFIVSFCACAISVIFRKLSPVTVSSRLFLSFFSVSFSVSGLMLMSLIHWTWVLCRVISMDLFAIFYIQKSS